MANVSVYNMEGNEVGKMDLNDAVFGVEVNEHLVKPVLRYLVAVENRGDRKEPDMHVRVQPELRSGPAAVSYSLRLREITQSDSTRKRREQL